MLKVGARKTAFVHRPQRILIKAMHLLWYRAVSRRNPNAWMVDGFRGTYAVDVLPDGQVVCNCRGFQIQGVCSHSVAVVMVMEEGRLKEAEERAKQA